MSEYKCPHCEYYMWEGKEFYECDVQDKVSKLEQENTELKAENERLKEENINLKWQQESDYQMVEDAETLIYDNDFYKREMNKYKQTLQEIKAIAEAPKPFIDFSVTKTATEVEYDYAAICNELELRLHKILMLIIKAESEG